MAFLAFFFPDLSPDLSSAELFFHEILTSTPTSMTSTIFLSLFRFIFIFAFASFCKQSFKIFSKIFSQPDRTELALTTSLAHLVIIA